MKGSSHLSTSPQPSNSDSISTSVPESSSESGSESQSQSNSGSDSYGTSRPSYSGSGSASNSESGSTSTSNSNSESNSESTSQSESESQSEDPSSDRPSYSTSDYPAIATPRVIPHQAAHRTLHPIARPTAVRIRSHRTPIPRIRTTHPNPTEADQATLDRNRQANRHMEVPVVVATALGFGRVAGNYSIQIVKVLNHPRAPAASTARSWRWLHDPLPSPHVG